MNIRRRRRPPTELQSSSREKQHCSLEGVADEIVTGLALLYRFGRPVAQIDRAVTVAKRPEPRDLCTAFRQKLASRTTSAREQHAERD